MRVIPGNRPHPAPDDVVIIHQNSDHLSSNPTTEKIERNKGKAVNNRDFLELKSGKRKDLRVPLMCPNHR
jgi:hypothetical protein